MAMIRCPECGEKYSDTYKECPFCEEEDALQQGGRIRRSSRGGKRAAGGRQPSLLSPILIVLILLMAALLVYLLFGDKIAEKLKGEEPVTPPTENVTPQEPDVNPTEDPTGTMPEEPEEPSDTPAVDPAALPETLTVNNPDFTLSVGESYTVKVTAGGSGSYTWSSSDDGIASVDSTGKVTAISNGKVTITVQDSAGKGSCTVYVKGGKTAATGTTTVTPSGGDSKLSREDFTLPKGDSWQLTVSGITTAVTWSTSNAGVATVSGNGTVTAVGRGDATITASWDGQSRTCIVRVP